MASTVALSKSYTGGFDAGYKKTGVPSEALFVLAGIITTYLGTQRDFIRQVNIIFYSLILAVLMVKSRML